MKKMHTRILSLLLAVALAAVEVEVAPDSHVAHAVNLVVDVDADATSVVFAIAPRTVVL